MAAPTLFAEGTLTVATSGDTASPTIPTHQADDILIVTIAAWRPNTPAGLDELSTPSGWSKASNEVEGSPINCELALYWRRATAAGTTFSLTQPVAWDTGNDGALASRAYVIRGCETSGDPWDNINTAVRTGSANLAFPSVTVSGSERTVIQFLVANDNDGTGSAPSGWTAGGTSSSTSGTDAEARAFYKENVSTSTTSDASSVAVRTAGFYTFFGISFKPPGASSHPITASGSTTTTGSAAINAKRPLTATGSTTTTGSAAIELVLPPVEHPITASGATTTDGSSAIGLRHAVSASGASTTTGSAALLTKHAITASGATTTTGTASINAQRPVTATATTTTTGSASIVATRPITASGATSTTGTAALSITHAVSASGSTTTTGSAAINIPAGAVSHPITASGSTTTTGSAAIGVSHPITASGSATTTGSAAVNAQRPLTASGSTTTTGSAAINAMRPASATGSITITGSAAIVAIRPIAASGTTSITGSAAINAKRPISASGTTTTTGTAAIGVRRPITASGSVTTSVRTTSFEYTSPDWYKGTGDVTLPVDGTAYEGLTYVRTRRITGTSLYPGTGHYQNLIVGQTYTLNVWARVPSTATTAQSMYVRHNIKDANNSNYWNAKTVSVPNDNTWRLYSFQFTINPPGGSFWPGDTQSWWIQHNGNMDIPTDYLDWDNVSVVSEGAPIRRIAPISASGSTTTTGSSDIRCRRALTSSASVSITGSAAIGLIAATQVLRLGTQAAQAKLGASPATLKH